MIYIHNIYVYFNLTAAINSICSKMRSGNTTKIIVLNLLVLFYKEEMSKNKRIAGIKCT